MGRDELEGSIKEKQNLTGKIQHGEVALQVLEDKYLLSGFRGNIRDCSFASVCLPAFSLKHQ